MIDVGDSGGGIFRWTGQYWEQVGIVSFGRGCGDPESPGVYTRLSYYYEWIRLMVETYGEHLEPSDLSNKTPSSNDSNSTIKYQSNVLKFLSLILVFYSFLS